MKVNKNILILSGITVLGAVLRFISLGSQSFWGDEMLSFDIVKHFSKFSEMMQYLKEVEIHPPLYYILLRYWTFLFGGSEFSARIPSVLFGLGIIVLIYFTGKRIFSSSKVGLLAAFLIAILPMQIELSQQARPYIIFGFFGLLAFLSLWNFLETRKIRFAVLYILSNTIGLYLHYSYAYILLGLAIFWSFDIFSGTRRFAKFRAWLLAHSIIFLAFAPWLPIFLYKFLLSREIIFGLATSSLSVRTTSFFEDVISQEFWMNQVSTMPQVTVLVKLFGMLALGYLVWESAKRIASSESGEPFGFPKRAFIYLGTMFFPLLVFFLFSPSSIPYSLLWQKHVFFITIPAALALSYLASKLPLKKAAVVIAIFSLSLVPFITDSVVNADGWLSYYNFKPAAELINPNYQDGDLVIVEETLSRTDFSHFLNANIPVVGFYPLKYIGIDSWNSRETLGFIENESQFRRLESVNTDVAGIIIKMNYLNKKYHPKRIWFYGLENKDYPLIFWFSQHQFKQRFSQLLDTKLPITLFSLE